MKKVLVGMISMLTLVFALSLCACGSTADEAVGEYGFSHMEYMGMTMDAEAMESFDMDVSGFKLDMKEDGTFSMTMAMDADIETSEGTWEKSGDVYTMTVNGDSVSAAYDAKEKTMTLTFEDSEEGSIVFKK